VASLGNPEDHGVVLHEPGHLSSPSTDPMMAMTAKTATKAEGWQHLLDRPSKAGSCPCSDCQEVTRGFLQEQSRQLPQLLESVPWTGRGPSPVLHWHCLRYGSAWTYSADVPWTANVPYKSLCKRTWISEPNEPGLGAALAIAARRAEASTQEKRAMVIAGDESFV